MPTPQAAPGDQSTTTDESAAAPPPAKRRGRLDLTRFPLPFDSLRAVHWWLRRTAFTKDRTAGPVLFIADDALADATATADLPALVHPPEPPVAGADATTARVRALLGVEHFAPGWRLSYNYVGEDLNLARPFLWPTSPYTDADGRRIEWWQTHVRGWSDEVDGGIELAPHIEPAPAEHPQAHADGTGLDREPGLETLGDLFEARSVDYERRER